MDAREEKQYAMTTVLVQFLADNTAAIAASAVAATEAADIAPAYALVTAAVGAAALNTKPTTAQATTARAALQAALPALLGPLRSVATKAGDTTLLAHATLSTKQLQQMKPEELRDVSKSLFDAADTHVKDLAPYALTAPVLAQLRALHTAFAGTVRSTATLIDQRSQGNQSASDLLRALLQQVYELDKPMEVFRFLTPTLYAAYKQARRVGKTSGGKKGGASDGTPPLA
ncbi:hypothetical protein [Hymenobacter rubidus]|uniref:hypothetical protein n=1 Tax=Hymenobacter rubidus TaxID=1441626 RepID=UPI00191EBC22|nr:hypothetical protein [Hymenobacter rubidus]